MYFHIYCYENTRWEKLQIFMLVLSGARYQLKVKSTSTSVRTCSGFRVLCLKVSGHVAQSPPLCMRSPGQCIFFVLFEVFWDLRYRTQGLGFRV